VRTSQPLQGQRNFRGKILGTSGGNIRLELSPGQEVEMPLSQIERANLVVEIQAARNGSLR
jgi:ribosome maturation factor RimP